MTENKVINNPDFTEDESLDPEAGNIDEGDEEVKKASPEEGEEEGDQPDTSTGEEPDEKVDTEDDADKERTLQGLDREERKLQKDLSDIDRDIEERREAIVKARQARRDKKEQLETMASPGEEEDDLSDIDSEDLTRLERVLRARGYVQKNELESHTFETAKTQAEDEFFNSHKEYLPANDRNNTLYDALKEEFGLFAKPKSPAMVKTLLNKAHNVVKDRYPDRFAKKGDTSVDRARKQKAALAGMGSGASGASAKERESSLTKVQREALIAGGFDANEVKDW